MVFDEWLLNKNYNIEHHFALPSQFNLKSHLKWPKPLNNVFSNAKCVVHGSWKVKLNAVNVDYQPHKYEH